MKKMRVFELAKDLGIDLKDLIKLAKDLAISVESNMSMLDIHDIERIKKRVEKQEEKGHEEGTVKEDVYTQKRVAPNVIRRRARVLSPPEDVPAEAKTEKKVTSEAKESEKNQEEEKKPQKIIELTAETKQEKKEATKESIIPKVEKPKEEIEKREVVLEIKPQEEVLPEEPQVTPKQELGREPERTSEELIQKKESEEEKEKKKEKKKGKKKIEEEVLLGEGKKEGPERVLFKKIVKIKDKQVFTQKDIYGEGRVPYGKKAKRLKQEKSPVVPLSVRKKKIKMGRSITVANLAKEMGVKVSDIIKILFDLGMMVTQNQYIGVDEATIVATELGHEIEAAKDEMQEDLFAPLECKTEDLASRPPVVTVMGHVDHGKTTLLDAIRSANVTESESGGITQHIGAYQAQCKGKLITFIDTPGHEAFTSMRARGALVTDFVILVVAADDGVMDQTKEAINHAKAAKVPIIVAINKIDKPNANPKIVMEQLSTLGLISEAWGGDTIFAEVSAKKRLGIEHLLEMILLQAEVMELKACPKGEARGIVLESKMDRNRGPMCTVLIKEGELNRGDVFVAGMQWGKARAMFDCHGKVMNSAGPAMPVELLGLNELPAAGDRFMVVPHEKKAREIVAYILEEKERNRAKEMKDSVSLTQLYDQIQEGQVKQLNLIVKGDVHGSVEAVVDALKRIETGGKIKTQIIHSAIGGITENDVLLASTTKSIIVGFNVRPDPKAKIVAKRDNIDIQLYTIIYDLIEHVKLALAGLLEPIYQEVFLGRAEVRDVFKIPKMGSIAGCMVAEGKVTRGSLARLLRDNVVVYEGKVGSLRRFKDDVKEVLAGYECGIGLEGFGDIKQGDVIETYTKERQEAAL